MNKTGPNGVQRIVTLLGQLRTIVRWRKQNRFITVIVFRLRSSATALFGWGHCEQLVAGFRRTVFVKIRISYQGEDLATQCG
jgi:hypothetical protein